MSTSLKDTYDALLLDLDGTVWAGHEPIPGAVENITASGLPTMYITNNASKAPEEVAGALRGIGLEVQPKDVMTSAQAAVTLAGASLQPGDPVLVIGAPSFADLVTEAGFRVVTSADDRPAVVLHGHHPDNGWKKLAEATLAITAGATYIASNLDSTLPTERGMVLGNGSMVAAVVNATGVRPEAAGKPGPAMFHLAKETLGSSRPLVVGDRLDTDIAGGVAARMDTLHVLTGVSGPWALVNAPVEHRPTFIAADMSGLGEDPDALRPSAQAGFSADVVPNRDSLEVELSGGDADATWLQALRTVLDAVWSTSGGEAGEVTVTADSPQAEAAIGQWW